MTTSTTTKEKEEAEAEAEATAAAMMIVEPLRNLHDRVTALEHKISKIEEKEPDHK